ncbi:hypothetical protein scyTo_0023357, partial [Scyliorhinus torazame]|nr:hypothetical protein [Scyliorhinus torazame]
NSKVTLDHRTAHKKLVISDHYTTLGVADQPQSYPDQAERFFNSPVPNKYIPRTGTARG